LLAPRKKTAMEKNRNLEEREIDTINWIDLYGLTGFTHHYLAYTAMAVEESGTE